MTLQQIKEYNNAGARCVQCGMIKESWVLFKGALELHLALEKAKSNTSHSFSRTAIIYIQQAETRYQLFQTLDLENFDVHDGAPAHKSSHLSLCKTPRVVKNGDDSYGIGVTVIFNLALVEHWKNPSSPQVLSMYALALSLSGPFKEPHLKAATLNNAGIWYFENGDVGSAKSCFERAMKLSVGSDRSSRERAVSNLRWISMHYRTSPAA